MNFNRSRDPDVIILQGDVNRLIEVAQAAGKELAQQNLTTSTVRRK